jgi:hypothetical protein
MHHFTAQPEAALPIPNRSRSQHCHRRAQSTCRPNQEAREAELRSANSSEDANEHPCARNREKKSRHGQVGSACRSLCVSSLGLMFKGFTIWVFRCRSKA